MSIITYPALDDNGWLTDPYGIANNLLVDWFLNNDSQSTIYSGSVASIGKDMQSGGTDQTLIMSAIEETLTTLFSKYFDTVVIELESIDNDSVSLRSTLLSGGKEYTLDRSIHSVEGYASELIEYNNTGEIVNSWTRETTTNI